MRIVLASFSSLPRTMGGGEVHVMGLALALKRLGHEPSLLSIEEVGKQNVSVRREYLSGLAIDFLSMPECETPYERNVKLTAWATEWLKEESVDLVHLFIFSHLLGLIPAAQHLKLPVCYTALEFSYFCRRYTMLFEGREHCQPGAKAKTCEQCALSSFNGRNRALAAVVNLLPNSVETRLRSIAYELTGKNWPAALGQRTLSNLIEAQRAAFEQEIAAVITPSTIMREFFLANGVSRAKLQFIPYGTAFDFQQVEAPSNTGTTLRVGYIGRLDPKKGVHVLCEALSQLPSNMPLQVKIYGPPESAPDDYMATLLQYINQDKRIQFMGRLEREEIPMAYSQIDVLVVPSLWYENSPITITEALAYKRPVICSDTPGMTDLVSNEINGLTFTMGDSAALASCLQRIVSDPHLLPQMQRRITPPETSVEIGQKIANLYLSIIERVRA